jgi:glycosyltransferase involved in cell wall biosynthesis
LAPALVSAGCSVEVVEGSGFESYDSPRAGRHDGVLLHRLERSRVAHWSEQFQHLQATPLLRRMMAGAWASWEQAGALEAFDVVESTDFALMSVPLVMSPRAPLVSQMHGSFGQIVTRDPMANAELDGVMSSMLETTAAAMSGALQTSSQANAAYWEAQTSREVACLRPAWRPPNPAAGPAASKPSRIVVFGRVQSWKGPHIVCEALRTMRAAPEIDWYGRDVPHGRYASTGDWLQRSYPEIWGLRIKPHAPVSPGEVQLLQSAALLNLVPSTWDVFNFTAVEAMASGRPVICSNAAGASELIDNGVTGFVYDGQSPASLAETLDRALSLTPQRLAEIGERAREMVLRTLDPETIAKERLTAYRALSHDQSSARKPADWLNQLARPRRPGAQDLAFLDQLPMRKLADYLVRRASRKTRSR